MDSSWSQYLAKKRIDTEVPKSIPSPYGNIDAICLGKQPLVFLRIRLSSWARQMAPFPSIEGWTTAVWR